MSYKNAFFLLVLLFLTACVTSPTRETWPGDIPSLGYFESYYDQDEDHQSAISRNEYLLWVKRFYYGSFLYSRGWKQATVETVATLQTVKEKQIVKNKMDVIGNLIAPEWAKNRDYRVVNTRHIVLWGNVLSDSIQRGEQIKAINTIHKDVEALLSGDIQPADIREERYGQTERIPDETLFTEK